MIEYKVERMETCLDEMKPLFEEHWEEIAHHQDKIKLNPNYDQYYKMEEMGMVHVCTVRDDGILIGYFVTFMVPHVHYQDHIWAMNDILFLHPDYRGTKEIAFNLFMFAEKKLVELGVSVIQLHMKLDFPFEPLAKACGYKKVEYNYSKYVGK